MLVKQIMNSNVVYLAPDDTAVRAAKLFARHNIGMLPVCSSDKKLRGVVTDRDITLRCVAYDNPPDETTLREIMTRGIITVSPNAEASDALRIMSSEKLQRLPVVDNEKLVGIISLGDIAQKRIYNAEVSSALAEIGISRDKRKRI